MIPAMRRRFSNTTGHTTTFTGPVSSSIVRNVTPFADLGHLTHVRRKRLDDILRQAMRLHNIADRSLGPIA